MNSNDFRFVDNVQRSYEQLVERCGQVDGGKTSTFDSFEEVKELLRVFSLLGSGLLVADYSNSVETVQNVLSLLVNNKTVSSCFPWHKLSDAHLGACAVHFARCSLGTAKLLELPDISQLNVSIQLLEKASSASFSDSETAMLLYIARLQKHSNSPLFANRIECVISNASNNYPNRIAPESIVAESWVNGSLFLLSRARVLNAIDSGPDSNRAATLAAVYATAELAVLHVGAAPAHAAALALTLCGSVHIAHRAAGIRIVRALASRGDARYLDVCFESLRDAIILPNSQIFLSALLCLKEVINSMRPSKATSLARPDLHRLSSIKLVFEAILRLTEHDNQGALAAAYSLPLVIEIGGVALLPQTQVFIEIFANLFIRNARGLLATKLELETQGWAFESGKEHELLKEKKSALDSLVCGFTEAARALWARIGAHRKSIIQASISAVLEAKDGDEVMKAAVKILSILLRCDRSNKSRRLMEFLRDKSARYNSLNKALQLLDQVLEKQVEPVRHQLLVGVLTNNFYEYNLYK